MASKFSRETDRIYSEMYEEGVEPLGWPQRFPKLESRAAWRNLAILVLVGAAIFVIPIAFAVSRLS